MDIVNRTDDYDNIKFTNCTNNENKFDVIIPTLLFEYHAEYHFYVY